MNKILDTLLSKKVNEIINEIKPMDEKEALRRIWDEADELEELLKKKRVVLMVAGNIGLGKTTTAKIISTFGKIPLDREDTNKELLKLYYDNMLAFAERLQIDLISQRLNQIAINNLLYPETSLIYDRTPYEDPLIFAKALQKYEQMSVESLEFCVDYFLLKKKELQQRFPKFQFDPDLLILLKASPENGWERIIARARAMELKKDARKGHGLTFDFYKLLDEFYRTFPQQIREIGWYKGSILTLEEDEIEVSDVTNTKGQLYVVQSIKEALKIFYANRND